GSISTSHDFVAGANTIEVVAAGQLAGSEAPRMRVSVGGTQLGVVDVSSTSFSSYSFKYNAGSAGARTVEVAFINDYYQNGADRNLLVDKLAVRCGGTDGTGGSGGTGGTGATGGDGGTGATGGSGGTGATGGSGGTGATGGSGGTGATGGSGGTGATGGGGGTGAT